MEKIKKWFRDKKIIIRTAMFFAGCVVLFLSSAGFGVGFLGWHIVLALVLVCPFVCELAKVGV